MAQEWTSLWTSLHRYIDHPGRAKHLWYRKSASTFKSGAVFAGAKGYAIGNSLAGYEFYTDVMLACECIFNDPETKECNVRKIMFDGQKEVDVVVFKLELEVDSLAERYRREALRWIASGYDEEFEQNEVVTRGPILPSAIVGEEVVKKSTNIC